jgi:alkylation response protein AidB-like acyl-CoA dehydrogenase
MTATDLKTPVMKAKGTGSLVDVIHRLGPGFRERSAGYDRNGTFVSRNYVDLREQRVFAALVPTELGGGGVAHAEMCEALRVLAQYCSSTALALSMHQHLLAGTIWRYKKGQGGEPLLKKVAADQPVLVSTGAKDWLESNGETQRVDGGYRVSGSKVFASQSAEGGILITSAPFNDPTEGWQVLHFPVPFSSEGVSILNDWDTLGMRGTGSNTVKLENVFIPEASVVLRRPRGQFHPFFNVITMVALPLIMSAYTGVTQRACQIALEYSRKRKGSPHLPYLVGEINNLLTAVEVQCADMVRFSNEYDFEPVDRNGHEMVTRKTNVANACIATVSKAMEVVGGQAFYRSLGLEQLFRDVQGARYHPMQEKEQLLFSGNFLLG